MAELEAVVSAVEQAVSLEAAADRLRCDIDLPGGIRWTRRRVQGVHRALTVLRGLLPEHFASCPATVSAFRVRLEMEALLPRLRELAADNLHVLPAPFGLCPAASSAVNPHPRANTKWGQTRRVRPVSVSRPSQSDPLPRRIDHEHA